MAEHIFKAIAPENSKVYSYGVDIKEDKINIKTQKVLQNRLGLDVGNQKPTQFDKKFIPKYSTIVVLDKFALEYIEQSGLISSKIIFWEIEDPYKRKIGHYYKTYSVLKGKIENLNEILK